MAKKPDLSYIEQMLLSNHSFDISRPKYIEKTGVDIPQDKSYTEKNSAVARKAKEYGYRIEVISEILRFKKN